MGILNTPAVRHLILITKAWFPSHENPNRGCWTWRVSQLTSTTIFMSKIGTKKSCNHHNQNTQPFFINNSLRTKLHIKNRQENFFLSDFILSKKPANTGFFASNVKSRIHLLEMGGVEPPSENPSTRTSPITAYYLISRAWALRLWQPIASRHARGLVAFGSYPAAKLLAGKFPA